MASGLLSVGRMSLDACFLAADDVVDAISVMLKKRYLFSLREVLRSLDNIAVKQDVKVARG